MLGNEQQAAQNIGSAEDDVKHGKTCHHWATRGKCLKGKDCLFVHAWVNPEKSGICRNFCLGKCFYTERACYFQHVHIPISEYEELAQGTTSYEELDQRVTNRLRELGKNRKGISRPLAIHQNTTHGFEYKHNNFNFSQEMMYNVGRINEREPKYDSFHRGRSGNRFHVQPFPHRIYNQPTSTAYQFYPAVPQFNVMQRASFAVRQQMPTLHAPFVPNINSNLQSSKSLASKSLASKSISRFGLLDNNKTEPKEATSVGRQYTDGNFNDRVNAAEFTIPTETSPKETKTIEVVGTNEVDNVTEINRNSDNDYSNAEGNLDGNIALKSPLEPSEGLLPSSPRINSLDTEVSSRPAEDVASIDNEDLSLSMKTNGMETTTFSYPKYMSRSLKGGNLTPEIPKLPKEDVPSEDADALSLSKKFSNADNSPGGGILSKIRTWRSPGSIYIEDDSKPDVQCVADSQGSTEGSLQKGLEGLHIEDKENRLVNQSKILTKAVEEWSCDDVYKFVLSITNAPWWMEYAESFRKDLVDGLTLLEYSNPTALQEDYPEIKKGHARTLLSAINRLHLSSRSRK